MYNTFDMRLFPDIEAKRDEIKKLEKCAHTRDTVQLLLIAKHFSYFFDTVL